MLSCVADNRIIEQEQYMNKDEGGKKKKKRDVYYIHLVHNRCETAVVEDKAIALSMESRGQLF